ncbi:MAG: tetratricopeptide repeat protein [Verrucomicrobia bacterium]|nr:tetratricopeptide repeat protein [Verrucomicrobiota bacterium]
MARANGMLKRFVYYPLCGIITVALVVTLLFVLRRTQIADELCRRGLKQYHEGRYEEALGLFLVALKCDPDNNEAVQYQALCYARLAPTYDVATVIDYLGSDNTDMQRLGLDLAIRRNLRGLVEHIAPLARSETDDVRREADVALRVLRSSHVRVKCLICLRDAMVTIEPGQGYPVACPSCHQVAAYPLWYCNTCNYLWVVTSGVAWSCPECGSPNVGSAPSPDEE